MNDQEERAFKAAYGFYSKWRGQIIETDEQWNELSADVGHLMADVFPDCILARNLITAVLDTLNELYKDGKKPVPAGYFGRDDI